MWDGISAPEHRPTPDPFTTEASRQVVNLSMDYDAAIFKTLIASESAKNPPTLLVV